MRLKYHDFDSSFTARSKYFAAMGLGTASSYTGSAKQNQAMIKAMREHGFHTGGLIGSMIKSTGEDGFVLAKAGEYILTENQFKELGKAIAIAEPFVKTAMQLPFKQGTIGSNISNDIQLNIQMYGVQDMDGFVKELRNNRGFEKLVQTMTIGRISGANSLSKYKY